MTWTGTREDGSVHRMPVEYALTVSGAVITHCEVTIDPADLPQVTEAGVEHWLGDVREADVDAAS